MKKVYQQPTTTTLVMAPASILCASGTPKGLIQINETAGTGLSGL